MDYQKAIIVGAPRSGTNMLRDVLTSFPGIETWPCDEINYIWRHGNLKYPGDAFPPELATDRVASCIRRAFDRMARRAGARTLVEKTCATSLRVAFVDRIFPEARYLFIVRDGVDVVGSAAERWTAPLDIPYLARKARFVPPADLPYYAGRYLQNRMRKLVSADRRLSLWGPVTEEMAAGAGNDSLTALCARQWRDCVERADRDLLRLADDRVIRIRYEKLVNEPAAETTRVLEFLEFATDAAEVRRATAGIRRASVGRGRTGLSAAQRAELRDIIGPSLERFDYEPA